MAAFSLVVSGSAFSAFDCSSFLNTDSESKKTQLENSRDSAVCALANLDASSAHQVTKILKNQQEASSETSLINFLAALQQQTSLDAELIKLAQSSACHLNRLGQCYLNHKVANEDGEGLIMLKLNNTVSKEYTEPVYFGYQTTVLVDGKDQAERVFRFTSSDVTSNTGCVFTNIPISELEALKQVNTVIQFSKNVALVEQTKELTKGLTKELAKELTKGQPDKTTPCANDNTRWLSGITLHKTLELFTKPEIYVNVGYYDDDNLVSKEVVDLPWVTSKGFNSGKHLLLRWPQRANKAKLVIMESDENFPFEVVIKDTDATIALKYIDPSDHADQSKALIDLSPNHWKKSLETDDYIGAATVYRGQVESEVPTVEGDAIFHFMNCPKH